MTKAVLRGEVRRRNADGDVVEVVRIALRFDEGLTPADPQSKSPNTCPFKMLGIYDSSAEGSEFSRKRVAELVFLHFDD